MPLFFFSLSLSLSFFLSILLFSVLFEIWERERERGRERRRNTERNRVCTIIKKTHNTMPVVSSFLFFFLFVPKEIYSWFSIYILHIPKAKTHIYPDSVRSRHMCVFLTRCAPHPPSFLACQPSGQRCPFRPDSPGWGGGDWREWMKVSDDWHESHQYCKSRGINPIYLCLQIHSPLLSNIPQDIHGRSPTMNLSVVDISRSLHTSRFIYQEFPRAPPQLLYCLPCSFENF